MRLINWFKHLFHKKSKQLSEEEEIYQQHPELRPEPRRGIIRSSEVFKARKLLEIKKANRKRRKTFSYGEHFKQRQPTTARKLWNPNAKLEED